MILSCIRIFSITSGTQLKLYGFPRQSEQYDATDAILYTSSMISKHYATENNHDQSEKNFNSTKMRVFA